MNRPQQSDADVKDVVIAGCRVHLSFSAGSPGRWRVRGTVRCGLEENGREQVFDTEDCDSREAAEREALKTATRLLGHNVDRNTSRVKNWN